ncbi:MAG: hypothetical protein ACT4NY_08645 [Pseudonocardiales bacterium]
MGATITEAIAGYLLPSTAVPRLEIFLPGGAHFMPLRRTIWAARSGPHDLAGHPRVRPQRASGLMDPAARVR